MCNIFHYFKQIKNMVKAPIYYQIFLSTQKSFLEKNYKSIIFADTLCNILAMKRVFHHIVNSALKVNIVNTSAHCFDCKIYSSRPFK